MQPHSARQSKLSTNKFFASAKAGDATGLQHLLKESGIDVNCVGNDGKTALAHAIIGQHISATSLLIRYGANVNQNYHISYHRDQLSMQMLSYEEPPIVTAARVGCAKIVAFLLEAGAKPDAQNECVGFQGNGRLKDRTALHFAVEDGNVELVLNLLLHNAEVNIEDRQREIPLHIAVRCKTNHCTKQNEVVRLLCEHGSEVNAINKIQCVPLYLAAFYACLDKVEMLLMYGAEVNYFCERESSYGTPLHIAAIKDRPRLAELLISHGASLNWSNALGYTPLQLNMNSHSKSDIASMLIYHGADLRGVDKFNYTLLAACIRNMRLDCEKLAKLLIFAGYNLNHDLWLMNNEERLLWFQTLPDSRSSIHGNEENGEAPQTSQVIPNIPIPAGRVQQLCAWLRQRQIKPGTLMELCRTVIRRAISVSVQGRSVQPGISLLPLPNAIRDFLLLRDVYNSLWNLFYQLRSFDICVSVTALIGHMSNQAYDKIYVIYLLFILYVFVVGREFFHLDF